MEEFQKLDKDSDHKLSKEEMRAAGDLGISWHPEKWRCRYVINGRSILINHP